MTPLLKCYVLFIAWLCPFSSCRSGEPHVRNCSSVYFVQEIKTQFNHIVYKLVPLVHTEPHAPVYTESVPVSFRLSPEFCSERSVYFSIHPAQDMLFQSTRSNVVFKKLLTWSQMNNEIWFSTLKLIRMIRSFKWFVQKHQFIHKWNTYNWILEQFNRSFQLQPLALTLFFITLFSILFILINQQTFFPMNKLEMQVSQMVN